MRPACAVLHMVIAATVPTTAVPATVARLLSVMLALMMEMPAAVARIFVGRLTAMLFVLRTSVVLLKGTLLLIVDLKLLLTSNIDTVAQQRITAKPLTVCSITARPVTPIRLLPEQIPQH